MEVVPTQSATSESVITKTDCLLLPQAPPDELGPVKAWSAPVTLLTYAPGVPDKNPLFLEKRVYQGSSGRVYPLPVVDSIAKKPELREWQAVHLENRFLRLMVLPEIGGRIHVGLDKRTGYDFFYRQNVIKPALVGLAGPWISGGVEFNWPQHHRPATYMPVEYAIEREPDGAITVWCSDHDPMTRMKGMHGLRLRPDSAVLEVRVRLYNRTQDTQTFLWWANVATRVHEQYQSFFPRDVRYAADHARRAVTEFPLCRGVYYGIDYGERSRTSVPEGERPAAFVPDGSYAPNDLGWYSNIPVPTSYMIAGSRGDFFGGYDHRAQAGTVAVANHHISPGKKQWTWGNHEFGYAWDRHLTDDDGPYVELMSGVYTDNQPDFSFLAPGETKSFSQFWYPISDIGVPDVANSQAALRVETTGTGARLHLQVTEYFPESSLHVKGPGRELACSVLDLTPETPVHQDFAFDWIRDHLEVLLEQHGTVILRYPLADDVPVAAPEVATEPPLPEQVLSNDELFLCGLHLEQYRHPTRMPETYWLEATRRDPGDSRALHALGRWNGRLGKFQEAAAYHRAAIFRLTRRNLNPYDGEPHYNLGLTLLALGDVKEAYEALYKSTWNAAWRGPAYHRLAEIDCSRGEWVTAADHLERSLRAEADNLNARNLLVVVLKRSGRSREAERLLLATCEMDMLDVGSRWLASGAAPIDGQRRLDLTLDLARSGLLEEALSVLRAPITAANDGSGAMLLYLQADLLARMGREAGSTEAYRAASEESADYVFPNRLEEMLLLERAIARNPSDARAPYYLGNLLYDRRRHNDAITQWERATDLDPEFPTAWRNLGIAYFNVRHDVAGAAAAFERARSLGPDDARVLYEQDQLHKRMGVRVEQRLALLENEQHLVARRDDLSVELATLFNNTAQPARARDLLETRSFGPWEGGEGLVLEQYVRANVLLAQSAIKGHDALSARLRLEAARHPPQNLGEAPHLLVNWSWVLYWTGLAHEAVGEEQQARSHWERAARQQSDFLEMKVQLISESTYWSALALRKLGREPEARSLLERIEAYALEMEGTTPTIDYFATSLPAMLLFEDDLRERQRISARFLQAQARLGYGDLDGGVQMLSDVLRLDTSHARARDLLAEFES